MVAKKLDAAVIPHIGPSLAKFVDGPGGWTPGEDVTAMAEAQDETTARDEVARIVGRAGDVVATESY